MKKVLLLSFCLFLIARPAHSALINVFKFMGVVQSFDQNNVRVLCQGRKVSIPKSTVFSGDIRVGEAIAFRLDSDQMQSIFLSRAPASSKSTR